MRTAIRATAVAVVLPLTLGTLAAAAPTTLAPPDYSGALSEPREDPYYPAKGDPRVDTLHYGLDLRWAPDTRTLTGTATIRLRVTRDVQRLQLDLGDPLRVHGVRLDGAPVSTRHPGKDLVIRTGALARNSRHTLRITYSGTPKPVQGPSTRSDIVSIGWTTTPSGDVWTMQEPFGAYTWYPVNDHPSDKAYYDVTIDTPKDLVGVFNGRLANRRVVDGRTVTRWHLDSPAASYLTTIAIGDYDRYRDTGPRGLPITYWVERRDRGLLPELRRTPGLIRWLERRVGPYPFDRIGAVVVDSDSAMETQTMVTMGDDVREQGAPWVEVLLHEYAHQWYGDTVTPNNWKDMWLNESFAMYLEILWSADKGYTSMREWRGFLWSNDQYLRDKYGPPGEYDRGEFGSGNVYYCGALMLDVLRGKLGDRMFARVLRAWPQSHRDTNADRGDWIRWLNRVTDRNLRPFVRDWLLSKRTPPR